MSNIKPNVFPSGDLSSTPVPTVSKEVETAIINQVYSDVKESTEPVNYSAIDAMKRRTEEQIRLRDAQIKQNSLLIDKYQFNTEAAINRPTTAHEQPTYQPPVNIPPTPPKTPVIENYGPNPASINPEIIALSQPHYDCVFDILPLPSEGKLYRNKRKSVRVGFLTTMDENILTSPNLLQSGQFLDILINRKLLESDLRYKDLHVGDRNAIMIWLRSTAYGEMYPITLRDETGEIFETEFNLSELKIKSLGAEPDENGFFDYSFKQSSANIKFKLLTVADVDEIEALQQADQAAEKMINMERTYTLQRHIVSVNGNTDKNAIYSFIDSLRIKDAKDFSSYISSIESGIDLEINVQTPRGGSVATFLPLNVNFFWPDIQL